MTKLIDIQVFGTIAVSLPIKKNLSKYDAGLSINVGALTLSLNGRKFILDSTGTNYTNPMKQGKTFELETSLGLDLETFEQGEDYNYELTVEDLKNKDLKIEFYCSDCDCATEDGFDFDNIQMELMLNVGGEEFTFNKVELE